MRELDAIRIVLDAIESLNLPYMIVGSLSSNAYGLARATQDADVLIEVEADDLTRLRHALSASRELRWDPQVRFESVTGKTYHVITLENPTFTIELFEQGDDPFDASRMSRRTLMLIDGVHRFVPTPEDVILQKLRWFRLARRAKDWTDALAVMTVQRDRLDWAYLKQWAIRLDFVEVLARLDTESGTH